MSNNDKENPALESEVQSSYAADGEVRRQRMIVCISSPSGGGKGTLIRRLLESVTNLGYSVSWTTRAPRDGEIEGQHYHFVSHEEFTRMRDAGEFLEWAHVYTNYYGTAWRSLEGTDGNMNDIVLEIDVQGAHIVRERIRDAVHIFILPPSYEVLRSRLINRASETPTDLAVRLHNAGAEVARYAEFDYVVLNDDVEAATARLAAIIHAERARTTRQHKLAADVLATFTGIQKQN
jgi:guanylate kinase